MISSKIMKHLRSYIKHSTQYFIRLQDALKSFLTKSAAPRLVFNSLLSEKISDETVRFTFDIVLLL